MTKRGALLAGLVAVCTAAIAGLGLRHSETPAAAWPDYSAAGPGFTLPAATPDGALIAYGYSLVSKTFALIGPEAPDASKHLAGNNLACQSCHLDAGTNPSGIPLVGVYRTYPKYSARSGGVISLAERIDECMTRSMNGRRLPDNSREMAAYLAYLKFIGQPKSMPADPAPAAGLPGDASRGTAVFARVCAACHQPDGLGKRRGAPGDALGYEFPPLWGPDSFNDGAGMDHFQRAVGFIHRNMPRGTDPAHPQLTLQEARDAAALLQSKPRPHYAPAR